MREISPSDLVNILQLGLDGKTTFSINRGKVFNNYPSGDFLSFSGDCSLELSPDKKYLLTFPGGYFKFDIDKSRKQELGVDPRASRTDSIHIPLLPKSTMTLSLIKDIAY